MNCRMALHGVLRAGLNVTCSSIVPTELVIDRVVLFPAVMEALI